MSGLKKTLKKDIKGDLSLNPVKRLKGKVSKIERRGNKIEGYFAKPKFPEEVPAEMQDEYTTSRSRNRDLIRRRQRGGRTSTIMSDSLG